MWGEAVAAECCRVREMCYGFVMEIDLKIEQTRWLEAAVAAGVFASVDDAVRLAVAGLIDAGESDDLAWAKPLVDEARASIALGHGHVAADVQAAMAERLRNLGAA
jgi:antitoxin ParD1/3/4